MAQTKVHSLFTDFDINIFKAGKHYRLYEKFGSHIINVDGEQGTYFAVWAPSAKSVAVVGDFNFWLEGEHKLNVRWDGSGIWEGFIPNVGKGSIYKYKIQSSNNNIITALHRVTTNTRHRSPNLSPCGNFWSFYGLIAVALLPQVSHSYSPPPHNCPSDRYSSIWL